MITRSLAADVITRQRSALRSKKETKVKKSGLLVILLLLGGCQTAAQRPAPDAPSAVDLVVAGQQREQARLEGLEKQISDLGGRLMLVQEQVLLLREQGESLALNAQAQVQALEKLRQQVAVLPEQQDAQWQKQLAQLGASKGDPEPRDVAPAVSQTAAVEPEAPFRLASVYTAAGRWVVLRYQVDSGATWYIEQGVWREVEELETPPVSRYQLVISAASSDKKGYVAARLDQQSGRSWWLKDNQWQPLEAE